jgi:hypothetical protein
MLQHAARIGGVLPQKCHFALVRCAVAAATNAVWIGLIARL